MKVHFDQNTDALYFRLGDSKISRSGLGAVADRMTFFRYPRQTCQGQTTKASQPVSVWLSPP